MLLQPTFGFLFYSQPVATVFGPWDAVRFSPICVEHLPLSVRRCYFEWSLSPIAYAIAASGVTAFIAAVWPNSAPADRVRGQVTTAVGLMTGLTVIAATVLGMAGHILCHEVP